MHKELELWQFVAERLTRDERVMLLIVAESSGSSPGRPGYKMAIGEDGELVGSIGGGVMEVNLVEQSRQILSEVRDSNSALGVPHSALSEQVHRKDAPNASGMICSGRQTVIFFLLRPDDGQEVTAILNSLTNGKRVWVRITREEFKLFAEENETVAADAAHFVASDTGFLYTEFLGFGNDLYIIGGGHCALALSELMSKMDFRISLFDDRPELNTIAKNEYVHDIKIVDSYERIGDHIPSGRNGYVVVMTLGYKTDEVIIRCLLDKEFKYFGVLGSKAKMSAMFKELRNDGISSDKLDRIHTPVGLPINSRTPEEIAVSIAAEIIAVKNGPVL